MPKAHALIIDDNRSNLVVMQQLLQLEDVAYVTMSSTKDLTRQLDAIKDIDVVFLDLEMPIVNGYDALTLIKEHPNFEHARVIAYSVHVSELHAAFDLGFDGFLGKPLSAEAFPNQLQRILNGERIGYLP
jgi:two-component system cell cycle response regulator DivK